MNILIPILVGMIIIIALTIPRLQVSTATGTTRHLNEKEQGAYQSVACALGLIILWWHNVPRFFHFLITVPWTIVILAFFVAWCIKLGVREMKRWFLRALFLSALWAIITSAWSDCNGRDIDHCPVAVQAGHAEPGPPARYVDTTFYAYIYDTAWYKLPIIPRDNENWVYTFDRQDSVAYQERYSDGSVITIPKVIHPGTRIEHVDSLGKILNVFVANEEGKFIFHLRPDVSYKVIGRRKALFKFWIKISPLQR